MTRKLVTRRTITDIYEHPNADALELARIDGWQVVVKRNEFLTGDDCIFFEIDSFLPADDDRFSFLAKSGVKKDESGRERIRLRTIKLRKELSQGLALPVSLFPELPEQYDVDFSEELEVIKYERPEPVVANAAGNFPSFIPKTDEDRIQNVWNRLASKYADVQFVPTLKLDGSSCTVFHLGMGHSDRWKGESHDVLHQGEKVAEVGVCSRKLQLKYDENSHFWKAVIDDGVIDSIKNMGDFAIQGEVMGPGVQGNKEKFNGYRFFAFALYDIDRGSYVPWEWAKDLLEYSGVPCVPVVAPPMYPFKEFSGVDEMLAFSDGPSINAKVREGIVWKSVGLDEPISFKSISNIYLLGGGDE